MNNLKISRKRLHLSRAKDQRKPGAMPGTLVHVGEQKVNDVSFQIVDYSPEKIDIVSSSTLEECLKCDDTSTPTWIQVCGLHDIEAIGRLLTHYDIHPLIQEDVLNTRHRPKVENFDDYLFVTVKELVDTSDDKSEIHQLSLILTERVLITFQEKPTPLFDPIFERLKHGKGRIRKSRPDYLMWAILDAAVDHYRIAIDHFSDQVEQIDDLIETHSSGFPGEKLHSIKKQVDHLYRIVRPAREVSSNLRRLDSELIHDETNIYWSDLNDHAQHAAESAEILRETVISLREYHRSVVGQKMNEVMQVLTSFATIFLPLTFVAGVYGMNFANMPELQWKWAYPALWIAFITMAAVMFLYFRRKKWI